MNDILNRLYTYFLGNRTLCRTSDSLCWLDPTGIYLGFITDFERVHEKNVQVSNWLNQAPTTQISYSFYNNRLVKLSYTFRASDEDKYYVDQLLLLHSLISLTDTINNIGNADSVFINEINANWTSDNWLRPWIITISLLTGAIVPIPLPPPIIYCEDYRTFTRSIGGTFPLSCLINVAVLANENNYTYKNYGTGYFNNFTHAWYWRWEFGALDLDNSAVVWALANSINGWKNLLVANETAIGVRFINDGLYTIKLMENYAGVEYSSSVTITSEDYVNGGYLMSINKVGTTLTLNVYMPTDLITPIAILTLTLHGNWNFSYLYAFSSYNVGVSESLDFTVQKLNLSYDGLGSLCNCIV